MNNLIVKIRTKLRVWRSAIRSRYIMWRSERDCARLLKKLTTVKKS